MKIKLIRPDVLLYIKEHNLLAKWKKAKKFFETDVRHSALRMELLEPGWRGIYSFRLDPKYRALFFIDQGKAEVFRITNHYKK